MSRIAKIQSSLKIIKSETHLIGEEIKAHLTDTMIKLNLKQVEYSMGSLYFESRELTPQGKPLYITLYDITNFFKETDFNQNHINEKLATRVDKLTADLNTCINEEDKEYLTHALVRVNLIGQVAQSLLELCDAFKTRKPLEEISNYCPGFCSVNG